MSTLCGLPAGWAAAVTGDVVMCMSALCGLTAGWAAAVTGDVVMCMSALRGLPAGWAAAVTGSAAVVRCHCPGQRLNTQTQAMVQRHAVML